MRRINRIFWHCSATPAGMDIKAGTIRKWHTLERGWSDIGYHWIIELDGTVKAGRPEWRTGAGVRGHNSDSIHICYVGGGRTQPRDTRTPEQRAALYKLTAEIIERYPGARVFGHNSIDRGKACPSFSAESDWREHLKSLTVPAPRGDGCPGCCVCLGEG